jgi:hypothetical protein
VALFQQLLLILEFRVVDAGFSLLTTHDRKPLSPVLWWCERSVVIAFLVSSCAPVSIHGSQQVQIWE